MKLTGRAIDRPADALIAVACAVAVLMMCHVVLDVFCKYVLNAPIEGTIETVAGYYMVVVVFFPFAYVAHKERHITVDLFTRALSRRSLLTLDGIVGLFTFAYMAVFTWQTVVEAIARTRQLEIWETGTKIIPIWPSRWLLPIGCGAMAIYVFYHMVRAFRGRDDA